jgi:predicted GIY-YIG superfamily endonuclease
VARRRARRDTYPYELKDGRKTVYLGITSDPKRREKEHRSEGKKFTRMIVQYPCSEENALRREQKRIESYRRSHGRKPKYNE